MSEQHDAVSTEPVRVSSDLAERKNEVAAHDQARDVQALEDIDDRETRRSAVSAAEDTDLASTDSHSERAAAEESTDRDAEPPQVPNDTVDIASADSMAASDPPSFTPTITGARKKK